MQLGICCSALQHELAARLSSRLQRNLGVATVVVISTETHEHAPLVESWEQASASDAVLLMLDHKSAPGPVKRDHWQSLLEHNGTPPVATLKLEPCSYPKLLERSRFFFAPNGNVCEAERWVERWLVSISAAIATDRPAIVSAAASTAGGPQPAWWTQVVDVPGVLTLDDTALDDVQTFASEAGAHFHSVVWMGCHQLPPAALSAEIEFRSATIDGGRLLFVLVHAGPDVPLPAVDASGTRHSFVIVKPPPVGEIESNGGSLLERAIGACRDSGFPGALLDLMLGPEHRRNWEPLVKPLTADRRWFRPRTAMLPDHESIRRHRETLQQVFAGWRRQPELCRELTSEATAAIQRDQLASRELCLDLARFLLDEKRMAEAVAWLRLLASAADEQDEFAIQAREELRWLVDEFGSYRRPQPIVSGEQVFFDFPGFVWPAEPVSVNDPLPLLDELRAASASSSTPRPRAGRQLQFDLFS